MKRSEIKVGEEYAATKSRNWTRWWDAKRVRVVDLGPFTQVSSWYQSRDMGVIDGTPTKDNYRRDPKGTYIAVRHVSDNFEPEARIRFVSITHLKTTWADYVAQQEATRVARSEQMERDAQRAAQLAAERAELAALAAQVGLGLDRPGEARWDEHNRVVLSRTAFRALLNATLAAAQPAEEAQP